MLTNFIGMPRLGDQLAQAAHQLVTFVIHQIVVIKLLKAGVHLAHLVNQRAAGDFRRVRGQYQLQRQGLDGFFDDRFVQFGLVFQFLQGAGNDFRIAGTFTFRRDAVVLLGGVCQVQKLAEGAGYRQQLVIRQVLQGSEQLLTVSLITGAGGFRQLTDGLYAVENVLSQRIFNGLSQQLAEHTDITTQCGILFVHVTQTPHSFYFVIPNSLQQEASGI